jgi:hypothetical protein
MMPFSKCGFGLLLIVIAAPAMANDPRNVQAPALSVGDSWIFSDTVEKGTNGFDQKVLDMTIERLNGATMVIGIKRDGAPGGYEDHMVGADWSKRQVVDGEEQATSRPFNFPLHVGQSWTIDYTDPTRRGNQLSAHVHRTYKVVGWEDVTVPAGTFHAVKVEADGVDEGLLEVPSTAAGGTAVGSTGAVSFSQAHRGGRGTLTRRYYSELYYVPSTKNYVKSVEEQYNTDNVRVVRSTRVLVSYKPAT